MKKTLLLLAAMLLCAVTNVKAAMFEGSPAPLQESSKNVVITFHADESGVSGLMNLSTDLYAHIGCTTNKKPSGWNYVGSTWGKAEEKYCFKRTAANTFQLTVGDLRTFMGVTDADEHITGLWLIARNATGGVQTKDYYMELTPEGFALGLTATPDEQYTLTSKNYTFTVNTTAAANIKLSVNGAVVKEASSATTLTHTLAVNEAGKEYEVKAVATANGQTAEAVYSVVYLGNSAQQNYPGGVPKQGAVRNSDGTVTFCIAAPNKKNVTLVGSWDDYGIHAKNVMKYQDYNGFRYFWTTVSGLKDSTYYLYYYFIDGKYNVADPYAHLVLDNNSEKWLVNDGNAWPVSAGRPEYPYEKFDDRMLAVYKSDLDNYDWKVKNFNVANPHSLVIYELCVRDFTGTSEKSDGTIRKAIEKIPYLADMGVTAVELLPIMEFDGNNSWGYATNFYMAPDKVYGSPDDYKEFIDVCHQYGIAVILDIVFNHTPGLHPWYQMYDGGTSPFYNKSCPHDFGVFEDIKQEYGLWEPHFIDALTYWLTAYKVDGFRFDLVKGLGDTSSYGSDKGVNNYNTSIVERMKRLHAAMKKVKPNVIHINEFLGNYNMDCDMANDGQYQWNNQTYHGQRFASGQGGDLKYLNAANCSRATCQTVDFFESHDEQWVGYAAKASTNSALKFNSANDVNLGNRMNRLASMGVQLLMSPGPKMIWQFAELGYDEQLTKSGRTSPKALHWEYLNVPERKFVYDTYAKIGTLRRNNPELFTSAATAQWSGFGDNLLARAIRVTNGNKEVVAFFNPSLTQAKDAEITVSKLTNDNKYLVISSNGINPTVTFSDGKAKVNLPINSFCVFATNNASGVEDILDDVAAENSAVAIGGMGEIIIVGEYDSVEVYNLSGQRMGGLRVAPGLYIVNVDGNASKVLVQ